MSAQISLDDASISKNTKVELEMFRFSAGNAWFADHCYELFVSSPYQDPTVYSTFQQGTPPNCEAVTTGMSVSCSSEKPDTLKFRLTALDPLMAT